MGDGMRFSVPERGGEKTFYRGPGTSRSLTVSLDPGLQLQPPRGWADAILEEGFPSFGRRLRVSDPNVIRIMCPNLGCQRVLAVPDHARGKLVRCRSCGTNIRIPATRGTPAPSNPGRAASAESEPESQTGQDVA